MLAGDAASKTLSQKITAWFRSSTGEDPTKIRAGYTLAGTATQSYLDPEFVATLGPAAMTNSANQAWLDKVWNYTAASAAGSGANAYYSASLLLQNMIVMSGNYWTPSGSFTTPSPNPTPTSSATGACSAFKQPYAGDPAYKKGQKVTFNGKAYVSTFEPNWWSPSAAPGYWSGTTC